MSSEQPRALVDLHGRSPWSILPALCLGFFMIMVDTTIVNGQVVVRNGALTRARLDPIVQAANDAAARMVERARRRTGLDFGSLAPRLAPLMRERPRIRRQGPPPRTDRNRRPP